jgi:hypothetical protein
MPAAIPSRVAEGRRCADRLHGDLVHFDFDRNHLDLIVELAKIVRIA